MARDASLRRSRPALERQEVRQWARTLAASARVYPLGATGLLVVAVVVVAALLAPWLAPRDPLAVVPSERLHSPSIQYLLGTDAYGRDMLSRIVWGARVSLWVGIVAVGIGTSLGMSLGLFSGYVGGMVDLIAQRFMDALMAFPALVLAVVITSALGTGTTNAMLAIGIVMMPSLARILRGVVLATKASPYIEAARAVGCGHLRTVLRHLLPNVLAPVIVVATANLGTAILTEASLSFLGLGTQSPTPSWGLDLSGEGRKYFEQAPWLAVGPGVAIALTVLGFNLVGDALRDAWDPRLRGR